MKKDKIEIFILYVLIFFFCFSVLDAQSKENPLVTRIYAQGYYDLNGNNPSDQVNDYRIFDRRADFISPDMLEFSLLKDPIIREIGFKLKLIGGETAKYIHARGLGDYDDAFDLTEAYVTYNFPLGNGLKMSLGKMGTFMGAETIEALDSPNFSRSFLFNFSQPITHTGLKACYEFSRNFNATVFAVNGWDNFNDGNSTPSIGLSLGFNPSEKVLMSFNFLNGPEQDNNNIDNRFLFDWVGTFKLSDRFSISANYDSGSEQNALPAGGRAVWDGVSLIGKYEFSDRFFISLRGEIFNDPDGYRTGIPQSLKELTLTTHFKVGSNMFIRPEYRHDWSNVNSFNNGTTDQQSTYGLGVMINY